ncbi:MAG: helix-turn-helix domain-containing protein [Candidatus Heimdallarchaeota archaeon]|nr:helix-turn-helix domain-containing protein [Candidatus Heimdallarchaeota archaeon]
MSSDKEKRSILLMHPVRREIFRIVSESPGSYFFEIASALELPYGTVSWHLKKLETAGLVDTMRFAGRRVFFSKGLRTEEVEKAFVVLRSEATQQVFMYILNNENCYQAQIADALGHHHDTIRHHIQRLKKAHLIDSVKRGRSVFYTLGEVGKRILNSNTEIISQAFVEHLFETLKDECLTPEILEHEEGRISIRISCPGKEDAYLDINLQGWEFTGDEDIDDLDVLEEEKDKLVTVEDQNRRPKVVRLDDELQPLD